MKKRKYIKRGAWIPMLLGLLLFAGVAAWMVRGVREASEVSQREGLRMAEEAVRLPRQLRGLEGQERFGHR